MVYKVCVDVGNYTTVAKCGENCSVIRTLLNNGKKRINRNAYMVKYKGEDYIVGDSNAVIVNEIKLNKMDETHLITLLTAVYHVVPDSADVELFIGMPISSYYNDEYRQKYELFMSAGDVELIVDGVKKRFAITDVTALPESIGYVYNNPSDRLIGVIDIGEFTVDGGVFKDGMPIKETIFTTLEGANKLKTEIRDTLNQTLIRNIQYYAIDEIIKDGLGGADSDKAKEIVDNVLKDYMKSIISSMISHHWEYDTMPIVFTGGGSLILKDVIPMIENFKLSENPTFDNVDGFEEMVVCCDVD